MRAARIYKHGGPDVFTVEDNVPEPTPGPTDLPAKRLAPTLSS